MKYDIDQYIATHTPFAMLREPNSAEIHYFDKLDGFIFTPFDTANNERLQATSREEYHESFEACHNALHDGEVNKVVLSRIKERELSESFSIERAFQKALTTYPHSMIYIYYDGVNEVWFGCTPELLLDYDRESNRGRSMALAGTRHSGTDEKWDSKNMEEHLIVARYIAGQLSICGISGDISEPYTTQAGGVEHLRTDISFHLEEKQLKTIVTALHPTPATCGFPREAAMEIIKRAEKHNRTYYSGLVGLSDQHRIALYVNLRCARIDISERRAYLYVGSGIMPNSTEEAEWEETELKSRTIGEML